MDQGGRSEGQGVDLVMLACSQCPVLRDNLNRSRHRNRDLEMALRQHWKDHQLLLRERERLRTELQEAHAEQRRLRELLLSKTEQPLPCCCSLPEVNFCPVHTRDA